MIVEYSEKAKQSGEGYALLLGATKYLEEIVGQPEDPVTAEWDRDEDAGGHAWFTLKLSDFMGSVRSKFAREELAHPINVRMRLRGLWGDLLQARSNALVKKLQELVKEGE
jgi:hypothetical protein